MNKRKYLILIVTLTILIVGCSNSKSNNKEGTNSNGDSEIISSTDSTEKSNSFKLNSGLLIGLAKDNNKSQELVTPFKRIPNEYRTLWVHEAKGKLTYEEKKAVIITPYKDNFYKVTNDKFTMSEPSGGDNSQGDDIFRNFSSYYKFNNISSYPADKPIKTLFTNENFKQEYLREKEDIVNCYKNQVQKLQYVGNNYACLLNDYYETGGGTYQGGGISFNMYKLGDLTTLNGQHKAVALADLLEESEKSKLKDFSKEYNKTISSEGMITEDQFADIKNLVLARKEGKWQVLVPIYKVLSHSGNGSNDRSVQQYINTDIKLPQAITSYDSLCIEWNIIKAKLPEAKDAISSPDKDMLAVLTPAKLLIYSDPMNGLTKPSLSIDVNSNESIILNQWATGAYVDKWSKLLSNY